MGTDSNKKLFGEFVKLSMELDNLRLTKKERTATIRKQSRSIKSEIKDAMGRNTILALDKAPPIEGVEKIPKYVKIRKGTAALSEDVIRHAVTRVESDDVFAVDMDESETISMDQIVKLILGQITRIRSERGTPSVSFTDAKPRGVAIETIDSAPIEIASLCAMYALLKHRETEATKETTERIKKGRKTLETVIKPRVKDVMTRSKLARVPIKAKESGSFTIKNEQKIKKPPLNIKSLQTEILPLAIATVLGVVGEGEGSAIPDRVRTEDAAMIFGKRIAELVTAIMKIIASRKTETVESIKLDRRI